MTIDEILALSAELDVAHRRVDELFEYRDRSSDDYAAWFRATREMAAAFGRLYPDEFQVGYQALKEGKARGVELAITYLEADPWSFRSGYVKANLLRFLKRIDLDDRSQGRLRDVVLRAVESRPRREFRAYCRMATVLDTPEFRDELRQRAGLPDPVGRHARWALEALGDHRPVKPHQVRCGLHT